MTFHTSHHLCFSYPYILYILSEMSLEAVNGGGTPCTFVWHLIKTRFLCLIFIFLSFSCFGVKGTLDMKELRVIPSYERIFSIQQFMN